MTKTNRNLNKDNKPNGWIPGFGVPDTLNMSREDQAKAFSGMTDKKEGRNSRGHRTTNYYPKMSDRKAKWTTFETLLSITMRYYQDANRNGWEDELMAQYYKELLDGDALDIMQDIMDNGHTLFNGLDPDDDANFPALIQAFMSEWTQHKAPGNALITAILKLQYKDYTKYGVPIEPKDWVSRIKRMIKLVDSNFLHVLGNGLNETQLANTTYAGLRTEETTYIEDELKHDVYDLENNGAAAAMWTDIMDFLTPYWTRNHQATYLKNKAEAEASSKRRRDDDDDDGDDAADGGGRRKKRRTGDYNRQSGGGARNNNSRSQQGGGPVLAITTAGASKAEDATKVQGATKVEAVRIEAISLTSRSMTATSIQAKVTSGMTAASVLEVPTSMLREPVSSKLGTILILPPGGQTR